MIKTVFGLVILAFIITHSMFWYKYGTAFPCEVAVLHIVEDADNKDDLAEAIVYKRELADIFHKEFGVASCYRVAVHGSDVMTGFIAKSLKEYKKRAAKHSKTKNEKPSK